MFNYFLNYGMVLTGPVFMRVVIIFGVPVSFVFNLILYGIEDFGMGSALRVTGAAVIVAGFILFNLAEFRLAKRPNKINTQLQV